MAVPPRLPMRTRLARWFRKPLVQRGLTVCAVLLTLEITSRLYLPKKAPLLVRDARTGHRMLPRINRRMWSDESQKYIRVRTNSHGFRDREWAKEKPRGTMRVAVLGDSFTEAIQVRETSTFCAVAERELTRLAPRQRWEVMNFGISGAATGDQLLRYREIVRQFDPDVVVLCFGMLTDVVDNSVEIAHTAMPRFALTSSGKLKYQPVDTRPPKTPWILRRSRYFTWQKAKLVRVWKRWQRQRRPLSWRDRLGLGSPPPQIERAWQVTAALLAEFQAQTWSAASEFIVINIPAPWQINADLADEMRARSGGPILLNTSLPESRLSNICNTHGISYASMTPVFQRLLAEQKLESTDLFFNGRSHCTPQAHRLIGRVIAEMVRERLAPPARVPRGESHSECG